MKNETVVINDLSDLNQQSEDVKGIFSKIEELRTKGYAMLNDVPAEKRTCAIKVKHRVDVIMERATEDSDQCVASNVESDPSHEINVRPIEATRNTLYLLEKNFFLLENLCSLIRRIASTMFCVKPI